MIFKIFSKFRNHDHKVCLVISVRLFEVDFLAIFELEGAVFYT